MTFNNLPFLILQFNMSIKFIKKNQYNHINLFHNQRKHFIAQVRNLINENLKNDVNCVK